METLKERIKNKIPFTKTFGAAVDFQGLELRKASSGSSDDFFKLLQSSINGLSESEVDDKRKLFGPNEIAHEKAPAWYSQLFEAFLNPFIIVLIILAIISFIMDVLLVPPGEADYKTVIVVIVMVLLSTLLRFWQEFTSNRAAEQLKSMVKTTATVLRQQDGKKEIDIIELVPGDMIPYDCRIIQSKDLFVSQSMLTGESLPVEK